MCFLASFALVALCPLVRCWWCLAWFWQSDKVGCPNEKSSFETTFLDALMGQLPAQTKLQFGDILWVQAKMNHVVNMKMSFGMHFMKPSRQTNCLKFLELFWRLFNAAIKSKVKLLALTNKVTVVSESNQRCLLINGRKSCSSYPKIACSATPWHVCASTRLPFLIRREG